MATLTSTTELKNDNTHIVIQKIVSPVDTTYYLSVYRMHEIFKTWYWYEPIRNKPENEHNFKKTLQYAKELLNTFK